MPITLGNNINSLRAQRELSKTTSALSKSFERLSSGLRINSAGDDAAGIAIATQLASNTRVLSQAIRNVNDGLSVANVAEGALNSLKEISQRQLELAEQASNGTYTFTQRKAMNTEANALVDEFNRIIGSTTFNGLNLLDPSLGSIIIQAGSGSVNTLTENTASDLSKVVGSATFGAQTTYAEALGFNGEVLLADFNRDGKIDIMSSKGSYLAGNGDGTFAAAVSIFAVGPDFGVTGDFNGDGNVDVLVTDASATAADLYLGNGNGTFKVMVSYTTGTATKRLATGDFNGDGFLDFATPNDNGTGSFDVLLGNGNGTFKAFISSPTQTFAWGITAGDLNNDGRLDIITGASGGASTITVSLGNGTGYFAAPISITGAISSADDVKLGDFNGDGNLDLAVANYAAGGYFTVFLGNGNGTFKAFASYKGPDHTETLALVDLNGDGILDIAAAGAFGTPNSIGVSLGNRDGTFKATALTTVSANPYSIKAADLNGDGVPDLVTGDYGVAYTSVYLQNTTRATTAPYLDLYSQSSAQSALSTVNATLDRIDAQLATIGAAQSRFQFVTSNLQTTVENYRAAHSRIMDVDVAEEAAKMVRLQVLQQAETAMLAQANKNPALVLRLLQ